MNFARGLLNDPWILFLDEPTLGLDVAAARAGPRARRRLEGGRARPDRPADDPLHGRGRRAVRAHRHRRPRPDPGHRHARGAQEARPARVDLPARARPPRRRPGGAGAHPRRRVGQPPRPTTTARSTARPWPQPRPRRRRRPRQRGRARSAGWARTSWPCRSRSRRLEDVFVELVGRGFDEDEPDARGTGPARRPTRTASRDDTATVDAEEAGRGRLTMSVYEFRHTDSPAAGRGLDPAPDHPDRPALGRRPRLSARVRDVPREVVALLRDPAAVPRRRRRSCSSTARCRRRREYIGFVVLGGALTAFWLNVVWMMASQLWWEKSQGNLELYFAAPMSIMSDPLRDGRRRHGHELDPGRRRPGRRRRSSTGSRSTSSSGSCSSRSSC